MKQRHNNKKGFSLVEAAIVLAVVGLVVAGIWVAASAVMENHKVTTTENDLLLIVRNIQRVFSKRDSESLGVGGNIWQARKMNIYPDNWTFDPKLFANNGGFYTPYGGTSYISSFPPGVSWDGFRIYLFSVPQSICIKLVRQITSVLSKSTGLAFKHLQISSTDNENSSIAANIFADQIPVLATTAHCAASTTNLLMFTFDYTRTN